MTCQQGLASGERGGHGGGGKLKPLAVTAAQRTALRPDVPTLGEDGVGQKPSVRPTIPSTCVIVSPLICTTQPPEQKNEPLLRIKVT